MDRLPFRNPQFDAAEVLRRWEQAGRRGAIVGLHGRGKTTLLEECLDHLSAAGNTILRQKLAFGERRLPSTFSQQLQDERNRNAVVVVDGVEQLSWWRWRQFLRRLQPTQGRLITLHHPGRLPTLVHCESTPALLVELVEELQETVTDKEEQHLGRLFDQQGGDLRLCLRALYDQYAAGTWPLA